MSIENAATANARTGRCADSPASHHAQPPSSSASEARSATESKNAPRGLAWPLPRAIAPSSRSLTPATITPTTAQPWWPVAISTAVDGRGEQAEDREGIGADTDASQPLAERV